MDIPTCVRAKSYRIIQRPTQEQINEAEQEKCFIISPFNGNFLAKTEIEEHCWGEGFLTALNLRTSNYHIIMLFPFGLDLVKSVEEQWAKMSDRVYRGE